MCIKRNTCTIHKCMLQKLEKCNLVHKVWIHYADTSTRLNTWYSIHPHNTCTVLCTLSNKATST